MRLLRGLAFRARTLPGTGRLVTLLVRFAPGVLPMRKLGHDDRFVAFAHPTPIVDGHVLLLPKRFVETIWQARGSRAEFAAFLRDAVALAASSGATQIFINAGARQDGRVVHVHGVPESAVDRDMEPIDDLAAVFDRIASYEDAAAFTVFVAFGGAGLSVAVDSVNAVRT